MTKRELLEKYYGMACHNLLCYSANYGMTKPRAGYEEEFKKAEEECELLKEMISELPSTSSEETLNAKNKYPFIIKEVGRIGETLKEYRGTYEDVQKLQQTGKYHIEIDWCGESEQFPNYAYYDKKPA